MLDNNFCPKCGKQVAGEAKFCDGCGAEMATFGTGGKKSRMPIIAVAVAVAIVVAVAGFFFWNSKLKPIDVDLTSSISKTDIEVAGTDGSGKVSIDSVSIKNNVIKQASTDREKEFLKKVDYEISPETKLSNGDRVTITVKYPIEAEDKYNIKASNVRRVFTISNFKEKEEKRASNVTVNLYDPQKYTDIDYYNSAYLSDAEINSMTKDQAQRAINDIYANHNYKFTTKKWASFYAKIGKQGTIPAEDFNEEEKFTSIEYDNYLRLKKHRDSF